MPHLISNEDLHTSIRMHKYATFAIVAFLVVLTFAVVLLVGRGTTNDQAYKTVTRASGVENAMQAEDAEDSSMVIPNRSFELWTNGKPDSWDGNAFDNVSQIPGKRGQYAVLLQSNGAFVSSGFNLLPTITIDPSYTRDINMRIVAEKTNASKVNGRFTIFDDQSGFECGVTFTPTLEWAAYTNQCHLPPNMKFFKLRVEINNAKDGSYVAIDKVNINKVTMPTSTIAPTNVVAPTTGPISPTQPVCTPHCKNVMNDGGYCGYTTAKKCGDSGSCGWEDCAGKSGGGGNPTCTAPAPGCSNYPCQAGQTAEAECTSGGTWQCKCK